MADDIRSDIVIGVDTSVGIAEIKNLQRQISQLNAQLLKSGAQQAAAAQNIQRNLINNINATGKFAAGVKNISSTAESFTTNLERNKLGMGEYFRYAAGATKTFGRVFTKEFDTIQKVAESRVKTLQTQYIKLGRDANGALKAIAVRPLALDMDNLATKTAIAAQKQQLFNQLLQQGSTNLLNFGKNTQWAGRQLMVGFTVPLAYLGTVAGKTFMKMEEQAIKFRRVYGDTFTATEDTEKMIKQVQQLANEFTKYGVAAEKTMEMAAQAAAMGLQNADLLAQVNQATRLAVLGGVEQEQALETTISLMNAFGTEAKDLTKNIDFLNAVENQTVTAIEDLTIAIPKAAPVIKQLGGDVEDLAFFLTAMKEGGINASEGANALKSGLASLINPTGKASEFLQGFGINLKGIVDANKGNVRGLVLDFAKALDTLDPLNRARAIEQLFGKFQFARLSTLFQNVVKEGTQAQRVLSITRQTTEELAILSERELKRVEDSPMYKFKKAVEDIKVSLIPLGEAFLKAITPVIEFAKGLLDRFNNMSEGAKNFVVVLTTLFAGIGPVLLMSFGLIANGVANLIKMFGLVSKVFRGAGTSSKDLGMSTDYMTQQQLEAAAVASSLDQTHSKLIQTFNVESSSVDKLAAAYSRAVAAQSRLVGPTMAPGAKGAAPRPKKYAKGVVSVPGPKGAGDVVPAMLSPGEAVIPAKQSQKYAGLISGMINDQIPGYSIGRNPFASMIKRSRVAVRTRRPDLEAMLQAGKNGRYKSAFETGTGADFLDIANRKNLKQQDLRRNMEQKLFGLGPDTPDSSRPTYGYARTSPVQALINKLFGFKGKQFNAVTANKRIGDFGTQGLIEKPGGGYMQNPSFQKDTLKRYGDIDIITKRSVGRRSQAAVTDALMDFERMGYLPNFGLSPVSMRGKGNFKSARFDRLSNPFGSYRTDPVNNPNAFTANPKPPYIETYTPGGFGVKEISKIRVPSIKEAREIQKLVDQAGLRIRVTPQNAPMAIKALANVFGTRFSTGTISVPPNTFSVNAKNAKELAQIQAHVNALTAEYGMSGKDMSNRVLQYLSNEKLDSNTFKKYAAAFGEIYHNESPNKIGKLLGETAAQQERLRGAPSSAGNIIDALEQEAKSNPKIRKDLETYKTLNRAFFDDVINDPQTKKDLDKFINNPDSDDLKKISAWQKEGLTAQQIKDRWLARKATLITGFDPNDPKKFHGLSRAHFGGLPGFIKRFQEGWGSEFTQPEPRVINGFISNLTQAGKDTKSMDALVAANKLSPVANSDELFKVLRSNGSLTPSQLTQLGQLSRVATQNGLIDSRTMRIVGSALGRVDVSGLTDRAAAVKSNQKAVRDLVTKFIFKGKRPAGYNKGVVSVPGPKGKGDVVPAMLSPGEAVIPAKMSEKYSSLISGMVNGTIPGYNDGYDPFGTPNQFGGSSSVGPASDPFGESNYNFNVKESRKFGAGMATGFAKKLLPFAQKFGSNIGEELKGSAKQIGTNIATNTKNGLVNAGSRFLSRILKTDVEGANGRTFRDGVEARVDKNGKEYFVQNGKRISRQTAMQSANQPQTRRQRMSTLKENYSNRMGRVSGAAGGAAGAAMMGAMMVGMGEGPMAKMANDIMPALLVASIALPLLGSIPGAIAVAVGSVVGALFLLQSRFDDAQKKVLEYSESMKASNKAVEAIAEFGGTVTATQIMDRRRAERDRELGAVAGKTTYGEAFVQTEAGKKQVAEIAKQLASGNRAGSVADMTSQLSSSVLSGAMSMSQARSMAASLANKAGDASIAIDVIAKIEKIFGPDGGDITKNPLKVRMDVLAENQKSMDASLNAAQGMSGFSKWQGSSGGRATSIIGMGAAGAGLGAAIGSAFTPVGTVIGAIAGGILGTLGGFAATEKATEEYAKLGAASAVDAKIALENNKLLLDSMDLFYEKKIEELKLQGKINEANAMQTKYMNERKTLTQGMADMNQAIIDGFNEDPMLQESLTSGAKKAVEAKYKDNADQLAYVDVVGAQANQLGLGGDIQYLINLKMASGEIPPATMRKLLDMAAGSEEAKTAVINIMTKFSGDVAGRTAELGNMLGDKELAKQLTLKVDAQPTDGDAQDLLNNISELTRLNTVIPAKVAADFYLKNPAAYNKFNKLMDTINDKKPKTIKAVLEIAPELKGKISKEDEAYFNTLTDEQKVVWTKTLVSQLYVPEPDIIASEDFKTWQSVQEDIDGYTYGGKQFANLDLATQVAHYRAQEAFKATQASALAPETPVVDGNTPGGGGAKDEPLDEVLQRLKEVRDSRINAKGGKKEMMRLLGGNKDITRFKGLEQQLMDLGADSAFADYLLGLDEAEQKKYFKVNKKTGTLNFTDLGKATKKGFADIALGDFNVQMKQATIDVKNQNIALQRLVASGMSVSDAYTAVEDTALAAALASKDLSKVELQQLTAEANRAAKAMAALEAARTVRSDIQEENRNIGFENLFSTDLSADTLIRKDLVFDKSGKPVMGKDGKQTTKDVKLGMSLGYLEQQAISSDSNLSEIFKQFMEGKIDKLPEDFSARIAQVMSSVEFKETIFNDGYNKAMERFAAKEKEIQIDADIKLRDFKLVGFDEVFGKGAKQIAAIAQDEIAGLQYQIDDWQAGLQEIAWQEDDINKAYDKKFEALEKIEQVNQRITAQQQKQLGIADALTRGDIAAAARAAQEFRDQSARDAIAAQRDSMNKAKQNELDALTAKTGVAAGMTRAQLDEKILANQKKIFKIEEERLEPAQEFIRDTQATADIQLQGIQDQKLTWEKTANNIEIAKVNTAEYTRAINSGVAMATDLAASYGKSRTQTQLSIQDPANMAGVLSGVAANTNVSTKPPTTTSGNGGGQTDKKEDPQPTAAQNAQQAFNKSGTSLSAFIRGTDKVAEPGSSKSMPISAPALTAESSPTSPQTFTVGVNKWFKMPKGATVYSSKSDGGFGKPATKWTLTYGKKPGLYTNSQGKTREWWSTKFGVGASGNPVQANEGLGFSQIPKDAHKQYPKSFPADFIGFNTGGFVGSKFSAKGTDTVPAMLTPGEFVVRKYAVENFGSDKLKSINNGTYKGDSMYNYEVNVNVQTDADADQIAKAVIGQIKQIDSQRIRGNRF